MPTTRQLVLHDNLLGGVETTLPAHLLKPDQWRTQHNMRLTPALEQVPRKKIRASLANMGTILWIGSVPNYVPGFGTIVLLTAARALLLDGTVLASGFNTSTEYQRWSVTLYNDSLYYVNLLNPVRRNDGSSDDAIT